MSHPITEADLLAAGYEQHRIPLSSGDLVDHFHQKSIALEADHFYQRSIVLEDGTVKYLIDIYHYDLSKYIPDRPDGYKVQAMFRKSNGGVFVVEHREECSIEDHEAFFEQIWGAKLTTYFNEDEL